MLPGPPVAVDIIAHGGSASRHAAEDLPARSAGQHGRSRNQRCGCGQGIPTQWRRPCLAVRSPLPWFCFVRVPIHLSSSVAIHDETVQPHLQLSSSLYERPHRPRRYLTSPCSSTFQPHKSFVVCLSISRHATYKIPCNCLVQYLSHHHHHRLPLIAITPPLRRT